MIKFNIRRVDASWAALEPVREADTDDAQSSAAPVPPRPLTVIEPSRTLTSHHLREVWTYRELLYFLVWRDLKVRYKQAALGIAWVVFQPLFMTLIFTVVLGMLVRVPSDNIPYPLFAYAGLSLWSFFASAVLSTSTSVVGNAHLITKVYFPRVLVPISSVLGRLVDVAVALIILVGLMVYFQTQISVRLLAAPLLVGLTALLALGLGTWAAAWNVKYRDVGIAVPVVIQLWMFLTPVVYASSLVPAKWQLLYSLNPMVGIIENFRAALFGTPFRWLSLGISAGVTCAVLIYATYSFKRREKSFADVI